MPRFIITQTGRVRAATSRAQTILANSTQDIVIAISQFEDGPIEEFSLQTLIKHMPAEAWYRAKRQVSPEVLGVLGASNSNYLQRRALVETGDMTLTETALGRDYIRENMDVASEAILEVTFDQYGANYESSEDDWNSNTIVELEEDEDGAPLPVPAETSNPLPQYHRTLRPYLHPYPSPNLYDISVGFGNASPPITGVQMPEELPTPSPEERNSLADSNT